MMIVGSHEIQKVLPEIDDTPIDLPISQAASYGPYFYNWTENPWHGMSSNNWASFWDGGYYDYDWSGGYWRITESGVPDGESREIDTGVYRTYTFRDDAASITSCRLSFDFAFETWSPHFFEDSYCYWYVGYQNGAGHGANNIDAYVDEGWLGGHSSYTVYHVNTEGSWDNNYNVYTGISVTPGNTYTFTIGTYGWIEDLDILNYDGCELRMNWFWLDNVGYNRYCLLDKLTGIYGETVDIDGDGFKPNANITEVRLGSTSISGSNLVGSKTINASGEIPDDFGFTIPVMAVGRYSSISIVTTEQTTTFTSAGGFPGFMVRLLINNNAQLATFATAGNGSASNPYILENHIINAGGFGVHGILINNTDRYFLLRNCTVIDASGYAGILLDNVTHGILTNNTINNNTNGILLQRGCHHNTLHNNTANYNGQHGIWLSESSNNTLRDNTALENYFGIQLRPYCVNNTLIHNMANNNWASGFRLREFCANNTLINNIATNNTQHGIYLYDNCHNNTLENNTANYNAQIGIYLNYNCDNNTLYDNTANYNTQHGIYLVGDCDSNTLTRNTAFNNTGTGIWIKEIPGTAANNDIIGNIITDNGDYGIKVDGDSNYFYRNAIFLNNPGEILDTGNGNTWVENLLNASGDYDGDGLVNDWEVDNSLDPWNPDVDGDGLTDGTEILLYFTNPTNPDTDGDGLNDSAEVLTYLTNATNPDTDGDGLNDTAEILTYLTNATNPDTDGDGLNDSAEILTFFTNATNPDTDGDGLNDTAELFIYPTNATNPDTDGDGLNDSAELFIYPTNATNPDTDADLMLDGWEIQHALNPINQNDALIDYDGDGLKNVEEQHHNTDPFDRDSDDDGYSDGVEVAAGTNPLDQYDFPRASTTEPESILLELSILIGCIALATAIFMHAILMRSRPVTTPPPKSALPAPEKPSKRT